MKRRFPVRRLSPSMAVSLAALFIALGGTSYAAFSLPKNSVGTRQLRKSAVTTAKIKNGAVTATKINTTGLTVPNALHANSADTAGSARSANNAASATNANHASTADSATNANNANNANALNGFAANQLMRLNTTSINSGTVNSGVDTTVLSTTITPGASQGFVRGDGTVSLYVPDATGCTGTGGTCYFSAWLALNGTQIGGIQYVTTHNSGDVVNVPVTAVGPISGTGPQTLELHVNEYSGTATATSYGNLTAQYSPFGHTGSSSLSAVHGSRSVLRPGAGG